MDPCATNPEHGILALTPLQRWRMSIKATNEVARLDTPKVALPERDDPADEEAVVWQKQFRAELVSICSSPRHSSGLMPASLNDLLLPSTVPMRGIFLLMAHVPLKCVMTGEHIRGLLSEAWRSLVPHTKPAAAAMFEALYVHFLPKAPALPGNAQRIPGFRDQVRRKLSLRVGKLTTRQCAEFWSTLQVCHALPATRRPEGSSSQASCSSINRPGEIASAACARRDERPVVSPLFTVNSGSQPYLMPIGDHPYWMADSRTQILLAERSPAAILKEALPPRRDASATEGR